MHYNGIRIAALDGPNGDVSLVESVDVVNGTRSDFCSIIILVTARTISVYIFPVCSFPSNVWNIDLH